MSNEEDKKFELAESFSKEVERCLLGCLILDRDYIPDILPVVGACCFASDWNKIIFNALLERYYSNLPVDLVIMSDALQLAGLLDVVGGTGYLVSLVDCVPSPINTVHYAAIIRDKYLLRKAGQKL